MINRNFHQISQRKLGRRTHREMKIHFRCEDFQCNQVRTLDSALREPVSEMIWEIVRHSNLTCLTAAAVTISPINVQHGPPPPTETLGLGVNRTGTKWRVWNGEGDSDGALIDAAF
jgi:hypothetical protein